MTIVTVTIKKKKALKALEALQADDLIEFTAPEKKHTARKRKEAIETHLASEKVLRKDWLLKKEDEAWQHL